MGNVRPLRRLNHPATKPNNQNTPSVSIGLGAILYISSQEKPFKKMPATSESVMILKFRIRWFLLQQQAFRRFSCVNAVPFKNEGDTVALITCEQGKYYVQSPVIPITGWGYNQKILLEKEPVNTSEESDHDSIPEITYWHEDFEYGTEEDHLDRWVIPIDEAEFLAASANYKNIQPDSTVQLPTDQGSYSVSLENGHTKVLSDCYEQSDAYRKYLYKGYLAEMNCYVFEYEGLEWEGISYVSKANGEEYGLRTQALFSLNQNCYCVDACTELEGERAGIIKVFQVSGGKFKFMFGLWSDKIFPQTVCWKDNTTLYVKALREENGADQTYYYKIPLDQVQ